MTIHLISFASILHKQVSLRSSHEAILSEIEKYYTVKFVDHQDMDKLSSDDFKIIFVATGGVERLLAESLDEILHEYKKGIFFFGAPELHNYIFR